MFTDAETYCGFTRAQFKKLLELCTKDNLFVFNDELYRQIDGAPMGGCVSPTLADVFLSHYEEIWLSNCPTDFKPVVYRRYVDDCFLLFKCKSHVPQFLNYLNAQHTRVKFTSEVEENDKLAFLDINVVKKGDKFETGLYRKPTSTGLGLKFDSAVTLRYKSNLIMCLIDRAYEISSNYQNFHIELDFLKGYFSRNNYPLNFIETCFRAKLSLIFDPPAKFHTADRKPFYISIPFISYTENNKIKIGIKSLIGQFYPQLDLKVIFYNRLTIGSFFAKQQVPTRLRSNIVYWFKCSQCSATYCGETKRHLHTRYCEHKGFSNRTGLLLKNPSHSHIRNHAELSNHPILMNDFKVLSGYSREDLKLAEAIYIHKDSPSLNVQDGSVTLNILS